jgi:hypothetical protein
MVNNAAALIDAADGDANELAKLRIAMQTDKNCELKDYKDLTKQEVDVSFRYLHGWAQQAMLAGWSGWEHNTKWLHTLSRILWSKDEAITPVPAAKKKRYMGVLRELSIGIQRRYTEEFKSLSKLGGIPLAYRGVESICDTFAVLLVGTIRNDDEKLIEKLAMDVVPAIMDPCRPFLEKIKGSRAEKDLAADLLTSLDQNSVGVGSERFIRRAVGAAAVVITRAIADGVIDPTDYPGYAEKVREKASKLSRHLRESDEHAEGRKQARRLAEAARIPTYGVARNAPRKSDEHRYTIRFSDAVVHVHVHKDVPMEKVLEHAVTMHKDVWIYYAQLDGDYDLFWQENQRITYDGIASLGYKSGVMPDRPGPDMNSERLACTAVLRAAVGVHVTVDALPLAAMKDPVDFGAMRQKMNDSIDDLINTPFNENLTQFTINIPNGRSTNFETKDFRLKPLLRSDAATRESFGTKLEAIVAKIKTYANERLAHHVEATAKGPYTQRAELVFYRNVSKIECKVTRFDRVTGDKIY